MSADPIGDALRADAEAARDEIRDAGVVCPSCKKNLADVVGAHAYEGVERGGIAAALLGRQTVRCGGGEPVDISALTWDQVRAVANIAFLDALWERMDEETGRAIIGTGGDYAGLLGSLP